jgi:hypothetical protein
MVDFESEEEAKQAIFVDNLGRRAMMDPATCQIDRPNRKKLPATE